MVRPVLSRFGVLEPKRSGLNTNPLLDSVGLRPLIDQYVYCLTTTFSFPLPEGDKLAPSTQKECVCGKKLVGKYLELGTCMSCTPKKPKEEYKCSVCEKALITHFREIGLCSECNKMKIRKEEKAAKRL